MDTQVADPLPGTLVNGRYRVRARLARWSPAVVYAATDERLGRAVMLHVAPPSAGGRPPAAATAARLVHPNVVAVYDEGEHEGTRYLVTEHVRARTLRELLGLRQRLTPVEAVAVLEQILAGLAAAHRAGITHGDLTPERIFVIESPSGGTADLVDSVVKIGDFSLLRPEAPGGARGGTATAAYVAPELVTEGRSDARSDVYSAGIVLFEMLTGQVPHRGATPAEVAWRHVEHDVPPPSRYAPGVPHVLDDLVLRATRRDPSARPTDAGAMLAEVQAVRDRVAAAATGGEADRTMVLRPVADGERPSWARLPSDRPRTHRTAASRTAWGLNRLPYRRVLVGVAAVLASVLLLVGGWWLTLGRYQATPDLVGLSEQAAVAHLQRLGLRVAYTDPAHSDEIPAGHVLAQDPAGDERVRRGGTVTLTLSLGPEVLVVPDIVGATAEVASKQVEEAGLVWREGEPDYSDTVPEGRVLAVEPAPGTEIRPGEEVTVTLSRGRAPIAVPSVIGLHVRLATAQLQQVGLQVTTVDVESSQPAGQVLNQDPAPGSGAEPGDTVTLEVSSGPPTIPVPNVVNQPCEAAVRLLQDQGFEVVPPPAVIGTVRHQDPPGDGTGIPRGGRVTLLCA